MAALEHDLKGRAERHVERDLGVKPEALPETESEQDSNEPNGVNTKGEQEAREKESKEPDRVN